MPIFTYKCKKCDHVFERLEGVIADEEELKCPECGDKNVEKQLSAFSIGKGPGGSPGVSSCPTGTCGL